MGNDTYGLVLFRFGADKTDINNIQLLVIKRRCSYAFGDFVNGTYQPTSHDFEDQLKHRINFMTSEEKTFIESLDFDLMFFKYHLSLPNKNVTTTEEFSKYITRLNKFRSTFLDADYGLKLRRFLKETSHINMLDLLEFPKGRPMPNETALTTAIRETEEETNIGPDHYQILNRDRPFNHTYTGADDKRIYKRIYFFGRINGDDKRLHTSVTHKCHSQRFEIEEILWLPIKFLELCLPLYSSVYNEVRAYAMNSFLNSEV